MELKFKQAIHKNGIFNRWHQWGWDILFPGVFTAPENPHDPSSQYTNLKDKNGKELYFDSDIVKTELFHYYLLIAKRTDIGEPVFCDVSGECIISFIDYFRLHELNEFEIIGTIQENPELLK